MRTLCALRLRPRSVAAEALVAAASVDWSPVGVLYWLIVCSGQARKMMSIQKALPLVVVGFDVVADKVASAVVFAVIGGVQPLPSATSCADCCACHRLCC